jgi:hypothetical protein
VTLLCAFATELLGLFAQSNCVIWRISDSAPVALSEHDSRSAFGSVKRLSRRKLTAKPDGRFGSIYYRANSQEARLLYPCKQTRKWLSRAAGMGQ